eukprot:1160499-Pelagomonas_calceolata.AAC.13
MQFSSYGTGSIHMTAHPCQAKLHPISFLTIPSNPCTITGPDVFMRWLANLVALDVALVGAVGCSVLPAGMKAK